MDRERITEQQTTYRRLREAGKLQEQAKQAKALRASLCTLQQQARDLHDRALTSSSAAVDFSEGFVAEHSKEVLADIELDLHPLLNLWRVWRPKSEAGE